MTRPKHDWPETKAYQARGMDITTLLADPAAINLDLLISESNSITLVVRTVQPHPCCPKSGCTIARSTHCFIVAAAG